MFMLNELNFQYFYRIRDGSPEYFIENGAYTFKYQAIGIQTSQEWADELITLMEHGEYQIRERAMMNDRVVRKVISPSEFILTFNEDNVQNFGLDELTDSKESFLQEVCRQDFPTINGPENKLQFNLYATHQLKAMCVNLQNKYTDKSKIRSSVGPIEDPEGYIPQVLPAWLNCNSFTIYSEDGTKSIRLMCPLFSYKYTLLGERSYCALKFLEWKDDQIAPYMYTVELDPVRELIQKLRLSIDGVVYLMYVQLGYNEYDSLDHPEINSPIYTLPDGETNTYYRKVDDRYMFTHLEQPDYLSFYDPVQAKRLNYTNFSIKGDCFPIGMTTCLLTVQPDMFRYLNLFRFSEYSIHADGYVAHKSIIERGFYTEEDADMIDLVANRLQYSYPIESYSFSQYISGMNETFSLKQPHISEGKILDMENVIYWSPCILLSSDYYAREIAGFRHQDKIVAVFNGNPCYRLPGHPYMITKGFLNIHDSSAKKKEYLYSLFDNLGCNTNIPTFFPVLIHGHVTTLTHRINADGSRDYLIIEPQNGDLSEAYYYLSRGNGHYLSGIPSIGAFIQFALTRTCRKNNHIKSLASPLPMYCSMDPALFKGNYLPIIEQALSSSYLLLRDSENTSGLSVSSLIFPTDFSVSIQTNASITDRSNFSVIDWLRIQASSLPLIGSIFSHPDIMVNLTEGISNDQLYVNFNDFLAYLSDSLSITVEKLLLPITPEEKTNIYIEITKSFFSMDDPSYDASYHISYLTYLYQRISAIYSVLYTGLKILYTNPKLARLYSLVHIQQFMELLSVIKQNLYTIEVYNQQSTREVTSQYEALLSPMISRDELRNLFYGKPFLRGLIKYQIMNPELLPTPFPFEQLIRYHIDSKPSLLRYRELYREMKNTDYNMRRVLNYLYVLNDTNQSDLASFIQKIHDTYKEALGYLDIVPDDLLRAIGFIFQLLEREIPKDFPEPTAEDLNNRLFSYFIFVINLYRFEKTSSLVNLLA